MTLGEPGKVGVRTSDLKDCQEILETFFKHGHKEIDTARIYAEGTTESVRDFYRAGMFVTLIGGSVSSQARIKGGQHRHEVSYCACGNI